MKRAVGVVVLWLAACSNGGLTSESAGLVGGDSTTADDTNPPTGTTATLRFQRAPIHGRVAPKIAPRVVDSKPITVVVTLSGQSVADVRATKGRKLTSTEKRDVTVARVAEQVAPRNAIEAVGGKVIGTFVHALNGIKVRIPANQVDMLRSIPGVVDIKRVSLVHAANVQSVPRIHAPVAWTATNAVPGVHGEHVKIAIVDSGIDYTHADFGGPGTVTAFQAAAAASAAPADPALFGANAPKVKGGTDLVGDAYDPTGTGDALIPHPDPNPLDCLGHGSHVAGTAAGFGVLSDGTTFHGSYDQTTDSSHSWNVGPGVAPLADLYAVRVFGCSDSSDVILNLHTGDVSVDFLAIAPTDSSTIQLPVLAASIGVTPGNPRFSYTVQSTDLLNTGSDVTSSAAGFNAFASALSNGQSVTVGPNATVTVPVSLNAAEFAVTPPLGLMVVVPDNASGAPEAGLVPVKL